MILLSPIKLSTKSTMSTIVGGFNIKMSIDLVGIHHFYCNG